MKNFDIFSLMMESCGKSSKIDYSDPFADCREIAACPRLRVFRRLLFVASFVQEFSAANLKLETKLMAGSEVSLMYFHLVHSPQFFSVAPGRKSTRNILHEVAEPSVPKDNDFVGNSTSPPFASLSYPFKMGRLFSSQKRLTTVFWAMEGFQKPKFLSCANFV